MGGTKEPILDGLHKFMRPTNAEAELVLLNHELKKALHEVEFWQTKYKAEHEVAEQWKAKAADLEMRVQNQSETIIRHQENSRKGTANWQRVYTALFILPEMIRGDFCGGNSADQIVRWIKTLAEKADGKHADFGPRATLPGSPHFHAIIREIGEMHAKKSADYGTNGDPFANIRASAGFGVPPWVGAMVRGNDKMQRIQAFIQNGKLENEPVQDSLLDLASYAIIAMCLFLEEKEGI